MSKTWYEIKNLSSDETEIFIYDEIGIFGIDAQTFVNELKAITTPKIILRINSPGGNVFDGLAIYNAIKNHDAIVITKIDAVAASMASVIALAGDEVEIAENAFIMIHNASGIAFGDSKEMRRVANLLEKVQNSIVQTYVNRTNLSEDEALSLMDETTWFNADEALENGFADRIGDQEEAEASFDLSVFNNVPDKLNQSSKHIPDNIRDFERNLRDSGCSRSEAMAIAACAFKYVPGNQGDPENNPSDSGEIELLESLNKLSNTLAQ